MFKYNQKVICIRAFPDAGLKLGDIRTINGLQQICPHLMLDVGIHIPYVGEICAKCGKEFNPNGAWWINDWHFAPFEEKSETNIEEFLNIVQVQIQEIQKN